MKTTLTFLLLLLACSGFAQSTNKTPINRGILQTDLDGNTKSATNLHNVKADSFIGDGSQLTGIGSGSQTPITANVNGAGFKGTNWGTLQATNINATNFNGALTGNASTATSATIFTGPMLGDVTGTQSASVVSLVGGSTAANVHAAELLANAAASANTASAVVRRDSSGNFTAGTITGSLAGNATTATTAGGAPPTGTAGGSLTGTYPNPGVSATGLTGTVPTNNLPPHLAALQVDNGVNLTNTEGWNTNTLFSVYYLNTNVVTFTNGPAGFNTNWTWSVSLNRYTNGGLYSIYFSVADQDWYWTNGAGQYFYDSQPCVNADEFTGFPYTTYINGDNSSQVSVATSPPPAGQYGTSASNATAYAQSQLQSATRFGDIGVNSIYNIAAGNVLLNPISIAPNAMLGTYQCLLYGEDCFMGGGGNNFVYGSGTGVIGSAGCFVLDTGGESVMIGSEGSVIVALHGVDGIYSSLNCTNYGSTVCSIINSIGSTIGSSSIINVSDTTIINGSSTLALGQLSFLVGRNTTNSSGGVTLIGAFNFETNSADSFAFGKSNNITGAAQAGAFGAGLTNISAGTVKVGTTNANLTFSNATTTVTGTLAGNGSGLTSLPAASLAGTVADARLSANVALLNASNVFTAGISNSGGLSIAGGFYAAGTNTMVGAKFTGNVTLNYATASKIVTTDANNGLSNIVVGAGLLYDGHTLTTNGGASGGSGTVTSVSGPSIITWATSTTTPTGTLNTQTSNTFLAGPTSGSAATPAFRAMIEADIPSTLAPVFNGANITNLFGRSGGAPTITTNATGLLGSGGTAALLTTMNGVTLDNNMPSFTVTVSTGTGATAGQWFHAAYPTTYPAVPDVQWSGESGPVVTFQFSTGGFFLTNRTTSGFDFYSQSGNSVASKLNLVFSFDCRPKN